jgi:6-phosphogluconolactonase
LYRHERELEDAMSVTFEIVEDPAHSCAALMVGAASADGHIVLAGGSTPKAANEHFVEAVQSVGLDLSGTTLWIGDERCVAPDDERSNYRMVEESLLSRLADPPPMHRIRGELGPEEGAADYERTLRSAGDPRFDLLLVGIGPDGHTLSLFPDQPSLGVTDRLLVGVSEAGLEPFVPRVSMTLAAVQRARRVVVLAAGESKADAIAAAFGPGARPDRSVPSSLLPEHARDLTVLIDPAAAARLPEGVRGS